MRNPEFRRQNIDNERIFNQALRRSTEQLQEWHAASLAALQPPPPVGLGMGQRRHQRRRLAEVVARGSGVRGGGGLACWSRSCAECPPPPPLRHSEASV